jgi:hypothetical protein
VAIVRARTHYVVLYPGEPRKWALVDQGVGRELDRRMTRAQYAARARVRVRTGTLLSTTRKNPGRSARGQFVDLKAGGRGATYVGVEEFGSMPHRITARRRKALRFVQGGRVQFRRSVRHPGTTGTFFLTRSLIFAAG